MSVSTATITEGFFPYLLGDESISGEAYLCLAVSRIASNYFRQYFFKWPNDAVRVNSFVANHARDKDVYFCPNLFNQELRAKEACLPGNLVWADLDEIDPESIPDIVPSCSVRSSDGRYQAYWRLDKLVPPDVREDYAKRLAYAIGADKSGWDLTQLLRVPGTQNFKYTPPHTVEILSAYEALVPTALFDVLPEASPIVANSGAEINGDGMPSLDELPSLENVLYAYKNEIRKFEDFPRLLSQDPPPQADWSALLWRLLVVCVECGMSREEVFAVAVGAACNKYARDNRPLSHLWRDVCKADFQHYEFSVNVLGEEFPTRMPVLVDPDKVEEDSLVALYKEWGEVATDAVSEYHELSCFIALSSVCCGGLYLATSFTEELAPNLWGLLIGESTLDRKTTCMNMAMGIVASLDEEAILATDGSVEGLLTGLSERPARVSIFQKDEVSGFFDAINKKDYLAGITEQFAQLYDVPQVLRRMLRKETITINKPYFIFFGGGVTDRVYAALDDSYILSGFLPRFLIVNGGGVDFNRFRNAGPPTAQSSTLKQNVINRFVEIKEQYQLKAAMEVAGQQILRPVRFEAKMDDAAWARYAEIETTLVKSASESPTSTVALPTFQRMAFSCLKMAMLVAASRREPNVDSRVLTVESSDLDQAAFYIQRWGRHTIDLMSNVGKPITEKKLDKIIHYVKVNQGITKSQLMQRFHLNTRETKDILETLQDRGIIAVKKSGRGQRITTVVPN